jgi:hypothetical protein
LRSFKVVHLTKKYVGDQGDQIKDYEQGSACGMNREEEKCMQGYSGET